MDQHKSITFEDVFINVPWGRIVGRWYGARNVRPILALHGWQDNLGTWDRLMPLLPQHISVLGIDLPGNGRSSKYPIGIIYHALDYVQLIARIVNEYKWCKVSLMGHSLGSSACFVYAALYPHMVDILIQIDLIKPVHYSSKTQIEKMKLLVEGSLMENERLEKLSSEEPPAFSYEQLENLLYNGSGRSVAKENCKYILNRNIKKSRLYPNKYYFSRDIRTKYIAEMSGEIGLAIEMANRIQNIAYILIRSDTITYLKPIDEQLLDILKANNSHFEYRTIHNSTHHLHLNNAEAVAAIINPFLLKHRPLRVDASAEIAGSADNSNTLKSKSKL